MKGLVYMYIAVFCMVGCTFQKEEAIKSGKTDSVHDTVGYLGYNTEYVEEASYPGGADSCKEFIYSHLKYPLKALQEKIEGVVIITFVIDEVGKGHHYQVARSVHPLLDEEALRVVKLIKQWKPSKRINIYTKELVPYKCKYAMPVKFELPL